MQDRVTETDFAEQNRKNKKKVCQFFVTVDFYIFLVLNHAST